MKKYLVLGAGGFIGKSLCKQLLKDETVKAYDMFEIDELKGYRNYEFVQGNFKEDNFGEILDGIDTVIHLISTTVPVDSSANAEKEMVENVVPTIRLLDAMVQKGIKKIIFASSGGTVYGETGELMNCESSALNPICSYGIQKVTIEMYLKLYGKMHDFDYRIMRIANPYGMGQDPRKPQGVIPIFVYRLIHGQEIAIFGAGDNFRDYIFMDDLINAFCKLLNYTGNQRIFNIGTGRVHSLNDIVEIIEKLSGKRFVGIEIKKGRSCDVKKALLDVEMTKKELNWEPKVSMEEGIERLLNYYGNL